MNHTHSTTLEELQSYSDYKSEIESKSRHTLDAVLANIAQSSLKDKDKKALLVDLFKEIQSDLFLKF